MPVIYLIGFMGSGKTTIGSRLAKHIHYKFIDLDRSIETKTRRTIPEIFETSGEEHFRKLEQQTLIEISGIAKNLVISTGGGTPCFVNTMNFMLQSGTCVYIKMHPQSLLIRILHSKKPRPLLEGMEEDELKTYIERKLAEREPFYCRAQHTVKGENLQIATLAEILGF